MQEMYGIEVDSTRVSKITDKLLPMIREWQNRPLESVYSMVLLDAIHYKVREDGVVVKKAVYIAIGTDLEGKKDVLGLWVGATESSKYWLGVLNGLKNRGVQDILIISVDGLSGFSEAIAVAYPQTEFSAASFIKSGVPPGTYPTRMLRPLRQRSSRYTRRRPRKAR